MRDRTRPRQRGLGRHQVARRRDSRSQLGRARVRVGDAGLRPLLQPMCSGCARRADDTHRHRCHVQLAIREHHDHRQSRRRTQPLTAPSPHRWPCQSHEVEGVVDAAGAASSWSSTAVAALAGSASWVPDPGHRGDVGHTLEVCNFPQNSPNGAPKQHLTNAQGTSRVSHNRPLTCGNVTILRTERSDYGCTTTSEFQTSRDPRERSTSRGSRALTARTSIQLAG